MKRTSGKRARPRKMRKPSRSGMELRTRDERWSLIENPIFGVTLIDEHYRFITTNQTFRTMTGYSRHELRQMTPLDISVPGERELNATLFKELQQDKRQHFEMIKQLRRKDGRLIWIHLYVFAIAGRASGMKRTFGINFDITEMKQAQDEVQILRTELARIARVTMMGELATSIAHEINQPLAAIVASGGACRRSLDSQNWTKMKESLETVIAAADRAAEVIKRVRSLTSNAAPKYLDVDVNVAVQEVLTVLGGELQVRHISLQLQLDNNVPPVKGDKVQLQQVVLNLVMNAIDAMATMTDRRRVLTIKSEGAKDGEVRVIVEDSGPGLDPAATERIFDPFFTTKPGGMGMGLSISKSIVENHGGRLWASPAVPGGTAFHFNLPTARRGEQWAN